MPAPMPEVRQACLPGLWYLIHHDARMMRETQFAHACMSLSMIISCLEIAKRCSHEPVRGPWVDMLEMKFKGLMFPVTHVARFVNVQGKFGLTEASRGRAVGGRFSGTLG
jgi:hypothetical protein